MTEEPISPKAWKIKVERPCECGCGENVSGSYFVRRGLRINRRYIVGHIGKCQPKLDKAYRWKGGRRKSHGYIEIKKPNHPFADPEGYVKEHRLVIEAYIGRYLSKDEGVHHRNGIKHDNRIENLQIVMQAEHNRITQTIDMSNRTCSICHSNKTTIKKENNRPHWYHWNRLLVCGACYQKQYRRNGFQVLHITGDNPRK